jgi:chromosome partitioning protein
MNIKGGVGKTTLSYATVCLFKRQVKLGKEPKVLAIDIDQQANLTRLLIRSEVKDMAERVNINMIFDNKVTPEKVAEEIIYASKVEYADIIPSSILIGINEYKNQSAIDSYNRLKRLISVIGDKYDLIVIDTPPSVDIYTTNALLAANYVVIPIAPNFLSTQGIKLLMDNIVNIQNYNSNLNILGLIINQTDRRYKEHKIFFQYLQRISKFKIYEPLIGMSAGIQKFVTNPKLISSREMFRSRGFWDLYRVTRNVLRDIFGPELVPIPEHENEELGVDYDAEEAIT